jgi:hypothetical protein
MRTARELTKGERRARGTSAALGAAPDDRIAKKTVAPSADARKSTYARAAAVEAFGLLDDTSDAPAFADTWAEWCRAQFRRRFQRPWSDVRLTRAHVEATMRLLHLRAWRSALVRRVDKYGLAMRGGKLAPIEAGTEAEHVGSFPQRGAPREVVRVRFVGRSSHFLTARDYALVAALLGFVRHRRGDFDTRLQRETAAMKKAIAEHGRGPWHRGPTAERPGSGSASSYPRTIRKR